MKSNSDEIYEKFKDYDFADAKPVAETPHLAKLQAAMGKKARITMRVDNNVLAVFKAQAELSHGNYQTLMNEALKQVAQGMHLSDMIRNTIRETLDKYFTKCLQKNNEENDYEELVMQSLLNHVKNISFIECISSEKINWLNKFKNIMDALKANAKIDILEFKYFITEEWITKVCKYLGGKGASFEIINETKSFPALQYFLHEAFEIYCLESKGYQNITAKDLEFNVVALDKRNECHIYALMFDYILLKKIASAFEYDISIGTLMGKDPTPSQETKKADLEKLKKIGLEFKDISTENKAAVDFFKKLYESTSLTKSR